MKVEYTPDHNAGPAKIIFYDTVVSDGPWSISIQRIADGAYATGGQPESWVKEQCFIPVKSSLISENSLVFPVSKLFAAALKPGGQYLISIKGNSDNIESAVLEIAEDNGVAIENHHNVQTPQPLTPKKQKSEKVNKAENEVKLVKDAEPLKDEPLTDLPGPGSDARRKFRILVLILLILFIIIWYFYAQPYMESMKSSGHDPENQETSSAQALSVEEQVRRFFRSGNITPGAAIQLAARLDKKTSSEQDAIYRLYYYAAESDEPEGLLEYAGCMDPYRPQWGTISKDGAQAWQIYAKAIQQKAPGAEEARDHLLEWLENQAKNGNSRAKSWLDQIEKTD